MTARPGTKGASGCDVLTSISCPILVRLKLSRAVLTVDPEIA
jgi:hypothetical protein